MYRILRIRSWYSQVSSHSSGSHNDRAKAQDTKFLEAVTYVTEEVFIRAEFFRLLPESIAV